MEAFQNFLTHPATLWSWCILVLCSLTYLIYDLKAKNPSIMSLMQWVWGLTVLYSGPLGLGVYFYSGRKQIKHDSLWRKGFRSVAHCYSGCGLGEVIGLILGIGILAFGNWGVAILTFALAYTAGFALTVGPLMQEGVPLSTALLDAFKSETASIAVMEIVAIGVDLWVAGSANMGDPLFWASMVFSLTVGLLAAYPVNVYLIKTGTKEGMMDPKRMD